MFPVAGLQVEVGRSSHKQLQLAGLQPAAAGTYRCEVGFLVSVCSACCQASAEGPSFRTAVGEATLAMVREKDLPRLTGLRANYTVGDTLRHLQTI